MTLRHALLTALFLATSLASASATELPLWAELTKTPKMYAADKAFVEEVGRIHNGDLKKGATYSVRQGWDAFGKSNYDIAIRRFNQAWLLDPENGEIYWGFALVSFLRSEPLTETERWFTEAERFIKNDAGLLTDHGRVLDERGEPTRAKPYFENALIIDPNDREAHVGMVQVLTKLGDKPGAEKHMAEVERLKKN